MDENTILARSENATYQVVEGEAILIRMDTGNYYSLNRVATSFWEMLDGKASIAALAKTIAKQYNASAVEFVAELRALAEKPAAASSDREEELAERYGIDTATVSESLPIVSGPNAESYAAELIATHSVSAETVANDLLELAKELEAEMLVESAGH